VGNEQQLCFSLLRIEVEAEAVRRDLKLRQKNLRVEEGVSQQDDIIGVGKGAAAQNVWSFRDIS
jgi:hypothetical protein